jgi:RNA polymerase sigma factor (sigma-70 family)
MSYIDKSEEEIIEGCKKHDREAQKCLYKLYCTKMNAISFRYTGSYEDAKDVVHDSFLHVFNKISLYKGIGSLEGWIRKIVVNKSIDFVNKKNKLRVNLAEEEQMVLNDSTTYKEYDNDQEAGDLGSIYSSGLKEEDILEAIDQLKESYRVIFNLCIIDNFSHKEVAEQLGITEETSRIRLKRARTALQVILLEMIGKKKRHSLTDLNNEKR